MLRTTCLATLSQHVGGCLLKFEVVKFEPITPNMSQQGAKHEQCRNCLARAK